MSNLHTHDWQLSQAESNSSTSRYQCSVCHRWGYRAWPRSGNVRPIVAYVGSYEPHPAGPPQWEFDRDFEQRKKHKSNPYNDEPAVHSPPFKWKKK